MSELLRTINELARKVDTVLFNSIIKQFVIHFNQQKEITRFSKEL